jgi:aminopeptidase N
MALRSTYDRLADAGPYSIDGAAMGRRVLRNTCLGYLVVADPANADLAQAQFDAQQNMTDVLAAIGALNDTDSSHRDAALAAFYARWRGDDLVLDKWFSIQALSSRPGTIDEVRRLAKLPDFDLRNPNRVRSLAGVFASGNQIRFHDASGAGYAFLADIIMAIDPLNSQTAARMVDPLGRWRRHEPGRAALMRAELERIRALPGLSRGTYEKVHKALGVTVD